MMKRWKNALSNQGSMLSRIRSHRFARGSRLGWRQRSFRNSSCKSLRTYKRFTRSSWKGFFKSSAHSSHSYARIVPSLCCSSSSRNTDHLGSSKVGLNLAIVAVIMHQKKEGHRVFHSDLRSIKCLVSSCIQRVYKLIWIRTSSADCTATVQKSISPLQKDKDPQAFAETI